MPNKHQPLKLSRDEELFLCHWMYDEMHYGAGAGPAKRLQIEQKVTPAEIAVLIAAAFPDPATQESAGLGPAPAQPPRWPWSPQSFQLRMAEARGGLAEVKPPGTSPPSSH